MADRVYEVVSGTFGLETESITDDHGPDRIPSWDSFGHVNLILALEAEFNVKISPDEATEMLSVGLIKKLLREKQVDGI